MPRAVITGIGAVTPLGNSVDESWQALIDGRRGIRPITRFDPGGLRNESAGQITDWQFSPADFGLQRHPDLATQFLLSAAREAIDDAGLAPRPPHPDRAAAAVATNFGGATTWERYAAGLFKGRPAAEAFHAASFHTALDHLCRIFHLHGPATVLSTACASGTAAIGVALDMIRHHRAEIVVCGGHDALAQTPLAGLSALRTITTDDILPFSPNRSGTIFGEGAAVLVLETLEHAAARGADIYCEVRGSWQNNNAYHTTAPDPGGHGMIRVLAGAIDDARIEPQDIDYINAHGTGTEYHDPEETHAIKSVLGDHAYDIAVSSIKGAIGHLMGAAGAFEAIATLKAIQTGVLPPTLNDGAADPDMDLDFVVNASRSATVDAAASISAGIGGNNACIVMSAVAAHEGAQPDA